MNYLFFRRPLKATSRGISRASPSVQRFPQLLSINCDKVGNKWFTVFFCCCCCLNRSCCFHSFSVTFNCSRPCTHLCHTRALKALLWRQIRTDYVFTHKPPGIFVTVTQTLLVVLSGENLQLWPWSVMSYTAEYELARVSFLSVSLSSMSSGVTTHSCKTNVLSRQSFDLHQPTASQRFISQPAGRSHGMGCVAAELLVLRPQESGGVLTVSLRQIPVLFFFYCYMGINWLWRWRTVVIRDCPQSVCPQQRG